MPETYETYEEAVKARQAFEEMCGSKGGFYQIKSKSTYELVWIDTTSD